LEVTEAVTAAVGSKKTGIRFSPWGKFQGDDLETITRFRRGANDNE
jgi:2,4-dienoyl-CoA reductase-like NADH-dependent reductase (Old Yellow Enzyme family)